MTIVPLWTADELGAIADRRVEHTTSPELFFPPRLVRNVTVPTISVHLPVGGNPTGTAVIVCPGGAFHFHSIEPEGTDVADWLNERGIAAFVLEYRLIQTADDPKQFEADMLNLFVNIPTRDHAPIFEPHQQAAVDDGLRAIEVVRAGASAWGLREDRIGILGFSAGGFVALGTAMQGRDASRPSFAGGIYPGMAEADAAPASPMPVFIATANDDQIGEPILTGSLRAYQLWTAAKAPVELHMYQSGGHGFGMKRSGAPSDAWIDDFHTWLTFNVSSGVLG